MVPSYYWMKAMEDLERQLKRGTLEMILLHMLAEEPRYGYELVSQLDERTGGAVSMKDGTLYPVLYRLEDRGLIEAEWSQPQRGVPRKYYRRTDAGTRHLEELRAQWSAFVDSVERLLASSGPARASDRSD